MYGGQMTISDDQQEPCFVCVVSFNELQVVFLLSKRIFLSKKLSVSCGSHWLIYLSITELYFLCSSLSFNLSFCNKSTFAIRNFVFRNFLTWFFCLRTISSAGVQAFAIYVFRLHLLKILWYARKIDLVND